MSVLVGRDGMFSVGCRVQSFSLTALPKRSHIDRQSRAAETLVNSPGTAICLACGDTTRTTLGMKLRIGHARMYI